MAVVVTTLVTAPSALACSCAEDPDAKETLHGYDAAATARLVDVKNKDPQTGSADLVYRITRVYKNRNLREGEKLVIKQSGGGGTCGLPRDKKRRYGLRLHRDRDDRLSSDSCALLGPKELRRAAERSGNARDGETIKCGGSAS
jgi:hypothetical protein